MCEICKEEAARRRAKNMESVSIRPSAASNCYDMREKEIRTHLRQVSGSDHYHLIKALDLMLEDLSTLFRKLS